MIVAFDNTFLTVLIKPSALPRPCPETGKPIDFCRERIEWLIETLERKSVRLIVPTPVLAEALVSAPTAERIIDALEAYSAVEIIPFDKRSAIELANITRKAIESGDKRSGSNADWQLVKFDRQIVAIAKAHGASTLYTDDKNQSSFAIMAGLMVTHTWDLEYPPAKAQGTLGL